MKSRVKEYQKYKILTLWKRLCPPLFPLSSSSSYFTSSGLPGMLKGRKKDRKNGFMENITLPPSPPTSPLSFSPLSRSLPLSLRLFLSLSQLMPRLNPFTITFNHYLSFYLLQPCCLNRGGATSPHGSCFKLFPSVRCTSLLKGPAVTQGSAVTVPHQITHCILRSCVEKWSIPRPYLLHRPITLKHVLNVVYSMTSIVSSASSI